MQNKFLILVCFYNAAPFIERCVGSIMSQDYKNYRVIFVDDASTDATLDLIDDNDKFIKIRNEVNLTALENLHNCIMNHSNDDEIIVILDGDDAFYGNKVLSYLNDYYNENNCLITYGQAVWTDGRNGFARQYTIEQFNNLRNSPWMVSHLRTFRSSVYKEIEKQDPDFSCMKDKDGNFYRITYDVAMMYPIMEISGYDKVKFIEKVLYLYNINNPISDHVLNQRLQTEVHIEINNKPKFKQIY
jgi:glycosyltransferase involved in cell wall biosynthesis